MSRVYKPIRVEVTGCHGYGYGFQIWTLEKPVPVTRVDGSFGIPVTRVTTAINIAIVDDVAGNYHNHTPQMQRNSERATQEWA